MRPVLRPDQYRGDGPTDTASVPHRTEITVVTQWALSVILIFFLAAVVIWNFPESGLRRSIIPVVTPVMKATGLNQSWAVFAPDPPRFSLEIVARIEYADGTSALWRPPKGGVFVGHYRTYRWRKWADLARQDANRDLWEPTARWVAGRFDHEDRTPTEVHLVRRWRELPPPGSNGQDETGREYTFFTLFLPADRS